MLPRLSAEESLLEAARMGVGSGSVKSEESRSIQAGWSSVAGARRPVMKATPADLAALGIEYRKVPKTPPPTP